MDRPPFEGHAVLATLLLVAGLAAKLALADPAPLPDRWLLKLVPDDLPALPDRFYTVTWYIADPNNQFGLSSWEYWADFHKPTQGRPAEALITLTGWSPAGLNNFLRTPLAAPAPKNRTARLAVHGPLVEFEGRLYTATIRTGKSDTSPHIKREMLHLGSAIEAKERVWYQAGTTTPRRGQGVSVEEWLIEFRDNPRTADRGKATLRGHWRVLTKPGGESFDAEVSFQAGSTSTGGRTVTLNWPHGMRQTRSLPHLVIDDARGGPNVIRVDDMHLLALYPAPKPRPELVPETVGLVQPPGKKARK